MEFVSVLTAASPPDPGALVELPALRTALTVLVLLSFAGGLLGTWVVLYRIAFFTHASGTATFPGLVVAQAAGVTPRLAGIVVALGYAGAVQWAGRERTRDLATGLVLVAALAGGVLLASDVFESSGGVDRLLFGSALGLDGGDIAFAAAAASLALLTTVTLGRVWAASAFDPAGARDLGLNTDLIDGALLALVATAGVAALPVVGALLVTSIFVVPAAIARLLTADIRRLLIAGVAIAAIQSASGLYVSLWLDVPPGPAIAVIGSLAYVVTAAVQTLAPELRPPPAPTERAP